MSTEIKQTEDEKKAKVSQDTREPVFEIQGPVKLRPKLLKAMGDLFVKCPELLKPIPADTRMDWPLMILALKSVMYLTDDVVSWLSDKDQLNTPSRTDTACNPLQLLLLGETDGDDPISVAAAFLAMRTWSSDQVELVSKDEKEAWLDVMDEQWQRLRRAFQDVDEFFDFVRIMLQRSQVPPNVSCHRESLTKLFQHGVPLEQDSNEESDCDDED